MTGQELLSYVNSILYNKFKHKIHTGQIFLYLSHIQCRLQALFYAFIQVSLKLHIEYKYLGYVQNYYQDEIKVLSQLFLLQYQLKVIQVISLADPKLAFLLFLLQWLFFNSALNLRNVYPHSQVKNQFCMAIESSQAYINIIIPLCHQLLDNMTKLYSQMSYKNFFQIICFPDNMNKIYRLYYNDLLYLIQYYIFIQMKNSSENLGLNELSSNNREFSTRFFDFCFKMSIEFQYIRQLYCFITILSISLTLIIYMGLTEIDIIKSKFIILDPVPGLCLISTILLIIIQLVIGIVKGIGGYLRIQTYAYLSIIYILGFLSLTHQIENQTALTMPVTIFILILCSCLGLIAGILFGDQSYKILVINTASMPLILHLLPFQMLLCLYTLDNTFFKNVILLLMLITTANNKFSQFQYHKIRKAKQLQFFLRRASVSLNFFYVINLLFLTIFQIKVFQIGYAYFFCAIALVMVYQLLDYFVDHLKPFPRDFFLNKCPMNIEQFLNRCQYVAQDIFRLLNYSNSKKIELSSTCLCAVYYEHLKNCMELECQLSHESISLDLFNKNYQKNASYKLLCNQICKIMENKFQAYIKQEPENIHLKLALIRFYVITSYNKMKILQLITQIQILEPNIFQKIDIYQIKKIAIEIEAAQSLENMKIDNSVQKFAKTVTTVLRIMVDFWTLMMEQKVDFGKVVKNSQKLFPQLDSIQSQISQAVMIETYSTIKILKIYEQFSRLIFHDQNKAAMINDFINLLGKKLSDISQLNYISVDCEQAIIAISLNSKSLGYINTVNGQALNIFNYTKEEMEKMKINQCMPKIYSSNHDAILEQFVKNPNKKLNTNSRSLIAKNKQGYLFPINLQLKKSVVTISQEMLFIADIQLTKLQNDPLIIICDEQGEITDYSSNFYYFFMKSMTKKEDREIKKVNNIQQIIPNFFSTIFENQGLVQSFSQIFDNPVYGVVQINFQISKISFANNRDAGYIIKGKKLKEIENIFYKHLNLTNSLIEMHQEEKLKGHLMTYISKNHQYLMEAAIKNYSGQVNSLFTIPFIKLEDITGAFFERKKQDMQKIFDQNIKTIRLCGNHYERVQEPQSFDTESDISHYNLHNNIKLIKLRSEFTSSKKKSTIQKFFIANYIINFSIMTIIILIFYFNKIENNIFVENLNRIDTAYSYRKLISEYIVYLQIEEASNPSQYTNHYKQIITQELIQMTLKSNIPQFQKQNAFRIIYLEQDQKVQDIINDETFRLPTNLIVSTTMDLQMCRVAFLLAIAIKIIINILLIKSYQNRLKEIYNLFLSMPESEIKRITENCLHVINSIIHESFIKKQEIAQDSQNSDSEDDQHIKIRKYRNLFLEDYKIQNFKVIVTSFMLLIFFFAMNIFHMERGQHYGSQEEAFKFMTTIIPQSSVYLMKVYLSQNEGHTFGIEQQFDHKIQIMDSQVYKLLHSKGSHLQNFFIWLFANPCQSVLQGASQDCQTIYNGVMKDGVSKALNLILNKLPSLQYQKDFQQQMLELTKILYQNIDPIFSKITDDLHAELTKEYQESLLQLTIELIIFIVLIAIDWLFMYYGPYNALKKRLLAAQMLLKIIPQSFQNKPKIKSGYQEVPT